MLWTYEQSGKLTNNAVPAVPHPPDDVIRHVAGVAEYPYVLSAWSKASAAVARKLRAEDLPHVLAVMVHPPDGPAYVEPWDWYLRVQVAAALVASNLGGPRVGRFPESQGFGRDHGWTGRLDQHGHGRTWESPRRRVRRASTARKPGKRTVPRSARWIDRQFSPREWPRPRRLGQPGTAEECSWSEVQAMSFEIFVFCKAAPTGLSESAETRAVGPVDVWLEAAHEVPASVRAKAPTLGACIHLAFRAGAGEEGLALASELARATAGVVIDEEGEVLDDHREGPLDASSFDELVARVRAKATDQVDAEVARNAARAREWDRRAATDPNAYREANDWSDVGGPNTPATPMRAATAGFGRTRSGLYVPERAPTRKKDKAPVAFRRAPPLDSLEGRSRRAVRGSEEARRIAEEAVDVAHTAQGDVLAAALEALARLGHTAALETLDFDALRTRTDPKLVDSVVAMLTRDRV